MLGKRVHGFVQRVLFSGHRPAPVAHALHGLRGRGGVGGRGRRSGRGLLGGLRGLAQLFFRLLPQRLGLAVFPLVERVGRLRLGRDGLVKGRHGGGGLFGVRALLPGGRLDLVPQILGLAGQLLLPGLEVLGLLLDSLALPLLLRLFGQRGHFFAQRLLFLGQGPAFFAGFLHGLGARGLSGLLPGGGGLLGRLCGFAEPGFRFVPRGCGLVVLPFLEGRGRLGLSRCGLVQGRHGCGGLLGVHTLLPRGRLGLILQILRFAAQRLLPGPKVPGLLPGGVVFPLLGHLLGQVLHARVQRALRLGQAGAVRAHVLKRAGGGVFTALRRRSPGGRLRGFLQFSGGDFPLLTSLGVLLLVQRRGRLPLGSLPLGHGLDGPLPLGRVNPRLDGLDGHPDPDLFGLTGQRLLAALQFLGFL